ncbi:SusC/RagA family TonB-linked outer membrane protein [Pseudozobellia thermophila]|uniref:TonB-linked outer membrane protein, SusC/RagA family n=1 Tax=Pseudozobellia thermophila TaxID=192903 RepID=A0A1M6CBU9_9FLAO|nr:TonB-dependent receptor [Pseudozobellia thermophila]SHI58492.1 TonB-linked outer membrane protein, SusC/RagA family [Pseudozobellia thermophila]
MTEFKLLKSRPPRWFFGLAMLSCFLLSGNLLAQTGNTVSGIVLDGALGEPLPGATILEKGTNNGTQTDFDGNFSLTLTSENAVLVFSYVGFAAQEVPVNGRSRIDVTLEEDAQSLDEVVIVGYGSVKRADVTGSVSSVTTDEITQRSVNNPLEGIQGNLPGVVITTNTGRVGDGFSVNIRGNNSFSGDAQPLFVVDGVPTDGIDFLNPQDIDRIDILKDASSAAIYGSRGANGVVLVTTKSGATAKGGVSVSVESSYGIVRRARFPDFMNGQEWWAYHQVAYLNQDDPLGDTPENNFSLASNNSPELVKRANSGFNFDWADAVYRDGEIQNNYVSVNGRANNGMAYNIALGLQKDKGLLPNEQLDKYTFKGGITHRFNDKFSAGVNLTMTHEINDLGSEQAARDAVRLSPLASPWAIDENGNQLEGELYFQPGKLVYPNGDWAFNKTSTLNPLVEIANSNQQKRRWRTLANMFLEYKAVDWLSFKTTFSAGQLNRRHGQAYSAESYVGQSNGGTNTASLDKLENFNYTWDNQFNINYTLDDDHSFSFLGLQSFYSNRTEESYAFSSGQPFETLWYNLGSGAQNTFNMSSGFRKNTLLSYAGRLNYAFRDKYLVTASIRWDGSSVLSEGNKWENFPSVALAWKLSEEGFLKDSPVVSNLKLRASIGYTGNDNVDPYSTLNGVDNQRYYDFNGNAVNGFISDELANRLLSWERTRELNFGLDFGLLNSRIYGSVDVYDRLSENLIVRQDLPIETGIPSVNNNVGSLSNKGVEVALVTRNVQTERVSWETNFTFSKNTNALESVYGQSEQDDPGNGFFIGEPLNAHYNYVFDGVWQASEAAEAASYGMKEGEAKPKDINNDGAFDPDDDRVILGSTQPDWIGGITSNLKVGNFDFTVSAIAMQGVLVKSDFLQDSFGNPSDRGRNHLAWDSYYVPANGAGLPTQVSNEIPRPRGEGQFWGTGFGYYRDASFVKVKNIALGYSFDQSVLDQLKIKGFRIYANVLNPFVFAASEFEGWDPEWADADQNLARPSSITYQLGLSLKL